MINKIKKGQNMEKSIGNIGSDIGYLRVSSVGQNLDRQLHGVELDEVFEDKCSAKDTNRPQLQECMRYLRSGDILHCHSIDRLARNLGDLENIVNELIERGVSVKFHKENLEFSGDDNPMSRLILQVMGSISQFERALINERRAEGVALSQQKGTKFGRKMKLSPDQIREIKDKVAGGVDKKALAEEYGISRQTVYNILK